MQPRKQADLLGAFTDAGSMEMMSNAQHVLTRDFTADPLIVAHALVISVSFLPLLAFATSLLLHECV